VVCAQNHDQIGNRALGDRLSMLVGTPQLKAIAALVLLSPFVPLLFQGEEWGARTPFLYFTDHLDPQLALAVAQGRREEFAGFGWQEEVPNPQERASFTRSKLDWSEIAIPRHADLLAWHQQLIRLRRRRALGSGCAKAQVNFDEQARWLTVTHAGILAVFNFAPQPQSVPLPPGAWQIALCSDSKHQAPPGSIGGWQTRVFTLA
jgi:maltooligosyltrehalose trehalohydrolase